MAYAQKVIHMDEHRGDGPQLENGFVRVANELEDALLLKIRTYRHSQVVRAIIRKTYGYGKKEDDITISQIAAITGLHRNHVGKALRELEEMRVLNRVRAGSHGLILGINKHHQQWGEATKTVAEESNQNGCFEQPKRLPEATKLVDFSNQKVAHNRQPQKTTPKDNSKRESAAGAAPPPAQVIEGEQKSKRAIQLPEGFAPNDSCIALAAELGVSVKAELEKFRDYNAAKGATAKDWQASFRNWIRKAHEFGRPAQAKLQAQATRVAGLPTGNML